MKSSIRSIFEAGLGKRMLAMIMDGAVFAFTFIALALWVFTPIINATMHYEELGQTGLKYEVFSDVYVALQRDGDNEVPVPISEFDKASGTLNYVPMYDYKTDDINFYKERVHYYYCCYKTGENTICLKDKNPEDFKSPNYNKYIKDNNGNDVLPKDFYTEEWFANLIKDKSSVEDFRKLGYDAVGDLRNSDYFVEVNSKISTCQLLMVIPPFAISYFAFYFLVPLLYKNGETFGKKVMHIGLVTKDCFQVKKRQIVFRQILLLAWVSLFSFVVGIGLTSLAVLGVGVVIYLVATAISKSKRSPIDYAAYTYMIDTAKSVWFKDQEEEDEKAAELEERMSKYKRYEPDKSKLIQIGTEIVNEDVKRELEEEKSKKVKKFF